MLKITSISTAFGNINYSVLFFCCFVKTETKNPSTAIPVHTRIIPFQPIPPIACAKTRFAIDAKRYPEKSNTPFMVETIPLLR